MARPTVNRATSVIMAVAWSSVIPANYVGAEGPGGSFTLVDRGRPAAHIVLSHQPTRAAQLAAYELQHHVKLVTGAELPLVKEPAKAEGVRILLGESSATKDIGIKGDDFGPQEYLIRFLPDTLILVGRDKDDRTEIKYDESDPFQFQTWPGLFDEQGTCHAVYDFLERFCGVRWYSPTELGTVAPQTKTLIVEGADVRRSPAFSYRDIGWPMGMSEVYNAVANLWPHKSPVQEEVDSLGYPELKERFPNGWHYIHAKRGVNRLFLHRRRLGGQAYRANHSFYGYYERFWEKGEKAADVFVEKKPDWFAQGHEGKPPQMCYTNDGFTRQVIQDARDYFDGKGAKPRAVAFGDFFALVPMDNSAYCKCIKCQALMNQDEAHSPFFSNGYASDCVFGFANRVAQAIKQSHPDKYLATLAYASYAYYPKRVRLEPNIAVQLCLHVRNTYATALQNNDLEFFDSWVTKEKDRPIYLWLYYCFPQEVADRGGWHCFPGSFSHSIDAWFKRFHEHGARGAFFNGWGQDVEAYVTCKLLDDPTQDVDALLDDYFTGYFGATAAPMKAFYLEVERAYCDVDNYEQAADGKHVGHQTEEMAWRLLGTEARMDALAAHVEEARRLANTDLEKRRVALFEREVWDYMRMGPQLTQLIERPDYPDHPAELTRLLYREPRIDTNDTAQGKPFVLETLGGYFAWKGKTTHGKGNPMTAFTDGDAAETVFFHHAEKVEIVAKCDLGPVPAEGRELRLVRLCWSMGDSQRSRANVKFAVRDAVTQEWRDVTGYLKVDKWEGVKPDCYKILSIPFPKGAVINFDAVRLVDAAALADVYPTRFTEIDVVTAP